MKCSMDGRLPACLPKVVDSWVYAEMRNEALVIQDSQRLYPQNRLHIIVTVVLIVNGLKNFIRKILLNKATIYLFRWQMIKQLFGFIRVYGSK